MPERRDTLFKGRPKSGLDFLNAPRQSGNRTKSPVHSMGYGLCVDVQKSGTTQIQNVLDKGYNLIFSVSRGTCLLNIFLVMLRLSCWAIKRNKFCLKHSIVSASDMALQDDVRRYLKPDTRIASWNFRPFLWNAPAGRLHMSKNGNKNPQATVSSPRTWPRS